ncbi:MAG: hypothetical protein M8357_11975 [Desulfobulbaceae bacterium]|nr:hypothetical protein [Desulfobulbaceae bacterium]
MRNKPLKSSPYHRMAGNSVAAQSFKLSASGTEPGKKLLLIRPDRITKTLELCQRVGIRFADDQRLFDPGQQNAASGKMILQTPFQFKAGGPGIDRDHKKKYGAENKCYFL